MKHGTEKPSLPDPVEEKTREKGEEKQPIKLKQVTLPHKFKIRGSGDTLPEMGLPDANSL